LKNAAAPLNNGFVRRSGSLAIFAAIRRAFIAL
jgi:hypothetical protein